MEEKTKTMTGQRSNPEALTQGNINNEKVVEQLRRLADEATDPNCEDYLLKDGRITPLQFFVAQKRMLKLLCLEETRISVRDFRWFILARDAMTEFIALTAISNGGWREFEEAIRLYEVDGDCDWFRAPVIHE